MDCFLNKEDGVSNLPLRDEASLIFRNKTMKERFEALGKDFGDELIRGVAKGDGPESGEGGGVILFGDKGKEGRVGVATNFLLPLVPMYHFEKILFY